MKNKLLRCGLAALMTIAAAPALAQSANLNDWTAAGDVVVDNASAARLSTAYRDSFSDEGAISATGSALLYFDLEPALGLPSGALAADTIEGSGLRQSFVTLAGTLVSFNWQLSTADFDAGEPDRAFVLIDGSILAPLATVSSGAVSGQFSHVFLTAGAHDLAVLVMDVNTADRVSTLSLSGLNVSAVPEPGSWALLLAGVAGLGLLRRRG